MEPDAIQDAGRLAASVPGRTALSPRGSEVGPAWLDLRGDSPAVALARVGWVGEALGACLALQESTRLFVATRFGSLDEIATTLSRSLIDAQPDSLRVAVVQGEDVLGRIEEFFVAGSELCRDGSPGHPLRGTAAALIEAVAEVPAHTLSAAVEAGADVIVSRSVDPTAIREALETNPAEEPSGRVAVRIVVGYETHASAPSEALRVDRVAGIAAALPPGVSLEWSPTGDRGLLRLRATSRDAMLEGCRRCHLLVSGLGSRLDRTIAPITEDWPTSVPPGMLEFGYDLRSASEWLDG